VTVRSQDIHKQVQDEMLHCLFSYFTAVSSQCRMSEILQIHNFKAQLNELSLISLLQHVKEHNNSKNYHICGM
jgi:hypothetical protein